MSSTFLITKSVNVIYIHIFLYSVVKTPFGNPAIKCYTMSITDLDKPTNLVG